MKDDTAHQSTHWPNLRNLGYGQGSKNEQIKFASRYLRGHIIDGLRQEDQWNFSEEQVQLLKFHGTYQQDDRDVRREQRASGEKAYQFMIRTRIPGGVLTAAQYIALDHIAGKYGNDTMRVTTRQAIQLHGILKGDLRATIQEINASLLSTLAACGDVNRNVMSCPVPASSGMRLQIQELAHQLAIHLAPKSRAYHEIWVDGEQYQVDAVPETEEEPIYGQTYLPRKFKIGIAYPGDNCIDVYTQDIGLVAVAEHEQLTGFTVLIGGGMGKTHGKSETFPRLGTPLCFIAVDKVVSVAEAIMTIYRDYGDRQNRRHARMKYLVEANGVDWFRDEIERRAGFSLEPPRQIAWDGIDDHLGVHRQSAGKWYVGIHVKNGRIQDTAEIRLRSALRQVIEQFQPGIRLTPQQNILLTDIPGAQKRSLLAVLTKYGIITQPEKAGTYRFAMACPALPTCGLAVAEAERVLPGIIQQIETDLHDLGLQEELLSVRMTGCPNGCARPYMGDIGIVGRSLNLYSIYIGGDIANTRLNMLYQESVSLESLAATIHPLFVLWKNERHERESFGDYCNRIGIESLKAKALMYLQISEKMGQDIQLPSYFPAMLHIAHRPAILIGGDTVALTKTHALLAYGAHVTVIAPVFCSELLQLGQLQQVVLHQKSYEPTDLDGAFLVVATIQDPATIESIWNETQRRGQLVNIVDVPARCTFIMPSILRRGPLSVIVSTNGTNPSMAKRIRQQLEEQFSPQFDDYLRLAAFAREQLRILGISYKERDNFFGKFFVSDILKHLEEDDQSKAISTVVAMMLEHVSTDGIPAD